jgi:hypothetical protein
VAFGNFASGPQDDEIWPLAQLSLEFVLFKNAKSLFTLATPDI